MDRLSDALLAVVVEAREDLRVPEEFLTNGADDLPPPAPPNPSLRDLELPHATEACFRERERKLKGWVKMAARAEKCKSATPTRSSVYAQMNSLKMYTSADH